MPVFDFSGASDKKPGVQSECTYTTFQSNEKETSPEKPIMILDNSSRQWKHHSCGIFTNPIKRTSFEFKEDDGVFSADIISIDSRFVSLLKWLGENHINVRLSGENKENGYAVYKIRETAFGGGTKLSAEDGFLQFMIERLLASSAPAELVEDEDEEEAGDEMKLTSIQSITDFMTCAGRTLPDNIRLWARRNLAVARSAEVSQEERRHAQLLANRIIELEGVPVLDPQKWFELARCKYDAPQEFDSVSLLKDNVASERCAIIRYQEIADFTNGKDFTTCDIAKHILAEEEEHEQDLQDYLTDIVRMKKSFLEK